MDLQFSTFRYSRISAINPISSSKFRHYRSSKFFTIRSNLPFSPQKAKYYKELEAAVNVVDRACRICVDVQKSLFSDDGNVLEKNDNSPVTIADFSVQALISLAEEDSGFLRSNNLADAVVNIVKDNTSFSYEQLTDDEVLEAIDRGGSNSIAFEAKPATYWVLDPIDGTRGFLKGGSALYVVGLALIVEGEMVLGVMGCPNWREHSLNKSRTDVEESQKNESSQGIIMAAHVGCGTWTIKLPEVLGGLMNMDSFWERSFVDGTSLVHEARFCIPESHTWDSIPLSNSLSATTNAANVGEKQILLLPACCGSLCKYLMVASGRASVFINRARAQTIMKAWDHAVGMICVHEAGGKVTDWRGSEINLAADEMGRRTIVPSGGVVVTNGTLHGQILGLMSSKSSVLP
ncbi:putative PAP-specific phosphatase, mitochondrial isoform X2 [Beta vulgaris subsp. vulgaris]|uniref:putative PAP-specific phosphatase, mitochondrial isoform X2 n=1 Tax=Beta vulgaris subsp. vulgaris TaxID=3555 RepID=UPI00203679C2|nr:putative PAP-specific phosphatase, mitochondrial isoform X2 [Beta vulgaris subsp. vulgaris]